jgi:nucleotide-binding universal stress UspA family protein
MFTQLLLAIDESASGEVATIFAAAYGRQHAVSVHVLFVNEYLIGGRGLTVLTRAEATELVTTAVQQLREAGVQASGSALVASQREVPSRIAEVAHTRGADAIVLGSNRHGRLHRVLSPKVRERTTRMTALPVLTAPAPLLATARMRLDLEGEVQRQSAREMRAIPK